MKRTKVYALRSEGRYYAQNDDMWVEELHPDCIFINRGVAKAVKNELSSMLDFIELVEFDLIVEFERDDHEE